MAKAEFPQVFLGFFRVLWNFGVFPPFLPNLGGAAPTSIQAKQRLPLRFWRCGERLVQQPYQWSGGAETIGHRLYQLRRKRLFDGQSGENGPLPPLEQVDRGVVRAKPFGWPGQHLAVVEGE